MTFGLNIKVVRRKDKKHYNEGSVRHGQNVFNKTTDIERVVRLIVVAVPAAAIAITTRNRKLSAGPYSRTSMPQAANNLLWLPHVGFET